MAFKGFFQRKPKKEEQNEKVKARDATKTEPKKKTDVKRGVVNWHALKSPHVTEKATDLLEKNQYVFKVNARTNKTEVAKTIENFYGVNVVAVRIVNIPAKKRRMGRTVGRKPGYKKAIIKLKKGQKIELLPR